MLKHLSYILCFSLAWQASAQNRVEEKASQLQQHQIKNLQEKIYAHLNRTDLITGEVLWFNLYTVDASQHQLSSLSKVAYIEILNRNNEAVAQAKVQLTNGLGHGSLYLPVTLTSGSYIFRAYTNWMKNQSANYFYQQVISIVNTLKSSDAQQTSNQSELRIELFPEGGNWVSGLPSQTAFKLTQKNGIGVAGHVAIINQHQDTIAQGITLVNGIGRVIFTPKAGDVYQAVAYNSRIGLTQQSITPIRESGYSLLTTDSANAIQVKVYGSESLPVSLIAHTRQSIKVIQSKKLNGGVAVFDIDKGMLGDGISHITIFDYENKPVCERLVFKKPAPSQLAVETNQNAYNVRRKISLNLSSSETKGYYSVSVYRADSLNSSSSIVSNLLLTSDLAGFVETPEYYFSESPSASLAADNLMLTHGWRRFNWNDLNQTAATPQHLPEVRGHLIQGKIVDANGNPLALKTGFLTNPGKKVRLYAARSNANGNINFQMKEFIGEGKIIAQVDYQTDSLARIRIENPFSTTPSNYVFPTLRLNQSFERPLVARSIGMQVQDIFREDETYFSFEEAQIDSIPFYGRADERYQLDDYTRFPSMEDVLREYVRGVWVSKVRNRFRFRVPDKVNGGLFKQNPLVLLDGVPVFDINQVLEVDPLKIKSIDVVARTYYIGPVDISGIVSFSSYAGDMANVTIDPRSVTINYEGLQQARQFYSPQYNSPSSRASRIPDQRHQLYWNPKVLLEPNTTTTLEFFTSDVEGNFFIVVEGISAQGKPATSIKTFSVSQ